MSTFKDIKVGDPVWMEDRSPKYREDINRELIKAVVVKVGRDYFYVKESPTAWREHKFHKEDGWEWAPPNYNGAYKWRAWRTPEEYEQPVQEAEDRARLAAFFRDYSAPRALTHEQVKAILNIILTA